MLPLLEMHFRQAEPPLDRFPDRLPLFRSLSVVRFDAPVTFLVGENGSGKSTLLETLACASNAITAGSESVASDPTLRDIREYARSVRLHWSKRTRRGFFLRAEDFFGYAKQIDAIRRDLEADLEAVERDYANRPAMAAGLAQMPLKRELHALRESYGDGLDANSHGEGFFKLFERRFTGPGLYLLDEPEAALSPTRQMALLRLIRQTVDAGGQFVIATHAPILLAYPGAIIWSLDGGQLQPVEYDDLDSVRLIRDFLNNRDAFLKPLLDLP